MINNKGNLMIRVMLLKMIKNKVFACLVGLSHQVHLLDKLFHS